MDLASITESLLTGNWLYNPVRTVTYVSKDWGTGLGDSGPVNSPTQIKAFIRQATTNEQMSTHEISCVAVIHSSQFTTDPKIGDTIEFDSRVYDVLFVEVNPMPDSDDRIWRLDLFVSSGNPAT